MDWSSEIEALAAVGTFLTAVATFYIGYITARNVKIIEEDRTASTRHALYAKQMEAFDELVQATIHYYDNMGKHVKAELLKGNTNIGKVIYDCDLFKQFNKIHRRWAALLPQEINEAILDFLFSYRDLKLETSRVHRHGQVEEEHVLLGGSPAEHYSKLILAIRRHLGTDVLTPRTLELMLGRRDTNDQWSDEDD